MCVCVCTGGGNEEARDGNSEAAAGVGRNSGAERRPAGDVPQETPGSRQPAHGTDRQDARRQTTVSALNTLADSGVILFHIYASSFFAAIL